MSIGPRGWSHDSTDGALVAQYDGTIAFYFDADEINVDLPTSFAATSTSGEAQFSNNVHIQSTLEAGSDGVGADGEQLTSGGAAAACDWAAAASLRQFKNILGLRSDEQKVLDQLVSTPVYDFRYKTKDEWDSDERLTTTGDAETVYTGIMADEAPWLMHYGGRIINPINTVGYLLMGIKALAQRVEELEAARA